jgi:hypothetical protein
MSSCQCVLDQKQSSINDQKYEIEFKFKFTTTDKSNLDSFLFYNYCSIQGPKINLAQSFLYWSKQVPSKF